MFFGVVLYNVLVARLIELIGWGKAKKVFAIF